MGKVGVLLEYEHTSYLVGEDVSEVYYSFNFLLVKNAKSLADDSYK